MSATRDPPPLRATAACVGRAEAIAEIDVVLEAAGRGRGGFVLITGEPGIGRTTLASEMFDRATARDLAGYWTACSSQAAIAPPYWPWSRLLQDCMSGAGAAELAELTEIIEPVLAMIGPGFVSSAAAGGGPAAVDDQFTLFQTVVRFWTVAARRRPILLVIDDLQWADPASIEMLAYLATELRQLPVVLLATTGTGEPVDDQIAAALSELDRSGPLVVQLHGLSHDALGELVRASGLAPNLTVVDLLYRRTAGNPFYATELLRMLDRGADGTASLEKLSSEIPRHVVRVVRRRLAGLDPSVRKLLQAASVIGPSGDATVLAEAAGVDLDHVWELLELCIELGIVAHHGEQGWRFVHPLLRDVILAALPVSQRRRLHERATEALATLAAPHSQSATRAQFMVELDHAIQLMVEAGTQHMSRREFDPAADCFTRAIDLGQAEVGKAAHGARLLLLAEAYRGAGHTTLAQAAFRAAAESAGGAAGLLGAAALGLAYPVLGLDLPREVVDDDVRDLLQQALTAVGDAESPLRVCLLVRLSVENFYSGGWKRSRALIDEAVALASRVGDTAVLVEAMSVRHGLHVVGLAPPGVALEESAEILRLAQNTGDLLSRWMAHRIHLFDLIIAADLTAVDVELVALMRLTEQLGNLPLHQWWTALWRGLRALLGGRHREAEAFGAAAWGTANPAAVSEAGANRLIQLVFLRREQSRLDELEPEVREFVANTPYSPATDTLSALRAAEMGRLDEAADALRRVAGQLDDMRDHRDWPGLWFQLSRVAYLVDDPGSAATLYSLGQRLAGRCVLISLAACGGAADLGLAWLADTLDKTDQAQEWYASAEAINVRIDARPWLAQTRVDHARMLAARDGTGDAVEAVRLAELAADAAGRMDLPAVLASARAVLDGRADTGRLAAANATTQGESAAPTSMVSVPAGTATFRRDGGLWAISYGGRTIGLPHAKGLADLRELLSHAGSPVHVSELVSLQIGAGAVQPGSDEILDGRARREIRQRLADLAEEAEDADADADLARAERARTERADLVASLSSALGLGGRARRLKDPMERGRKTVTARIRSSMHRIGQDHPLLGRHLDASVNTGLWCVYRPEQPVAWRT